MAVGHDVSVFLILLRAQREATIQLKSHSRMCVKCVPGMVLFTITELWARGGESLLFPCNG